MVLYAKGTNFRITIPSRSIEDIKLPDESYNADFELAKRYEEFGKEIIRFSLLGIAGYGFLIEHVVDTHHVAISILILISVGLSSLVFAAGVGLYCGQLNRACLLMQVAILRLLQRTQADRWTNSALSTAVDVETWKAANASDLRSLREGQAVSLRRAHIMQRVAVWLLILGLVATAAVFIRCLYLKT